MSAAVAEVSSDRLVTAPPDGRTFFARRSGLRLVMVKDRTRFDAEGNAIETIRGKHVAFVDGKLTVPSSGKLKGEGGDVLDAAEVLEFLESHHLNGDREEGFWLVEQPAPAPSEAEQEQLAQLGMDLDVEGLERFVAQEKAGWARPALLGVARGSLERARAKREENERALAAARAEGEAAAKSRPVAKGGGVRVE